jgi:hypothetical protein
MMSHQNHCKLIHYKCSVENIFESAGFTKMILPNTMISEFAFWVKGIFSRVKVNSSYMYIKKPLPFNARQRGRAV